MDIDRRPYKKFRQGFIGASAAAGGEREQVTGSFALGSFYGVTVGVCPGVGPKGWLRSSAHPFGGVVCRGQVQ